jgi:hypothetical protein
MSIQTHQYAFQDCDVSLPFGGVKKLAAGIYPVVIANGYAKIDVITETLVTLAEFARLQSEGLARKVP